MNEFKSDYERAEDDGNKIQKETKMIQEFMDTFEQILNGFSVFEEKVNINPEMLKKLKKDSCEWKIYQVWLRKKDELKKLYKELNNPERKDK